MHASYGAKSIHVAKVDKMSEASLPNVDSILSSYEKRYYYHVWGMEAVPQEHK